VVIWKYPANSGPEHFTMSSRFTALTPEQIDYLERYRRRPRP